MANKKTSKPAKKSTPAAGRTTRKVQKAKAIKPVHKDRSELVIPEHERAFHTPEAKDSAQRSAEWFAKNPPKAATKEDFDRLRDELRVTITPKGEAALDAADEPKIPKDHYFKPGDRVMVTGPAVVTEHCGIEDYLLTGLEGNVESLHENGCTVFVTLDGSATPTALLASQLMHVTTTSRRAAHMTAVHGYDKDAGQPADKAKALRNGKILLAVACIAILLAIAIKVGLPAFAQNQAQQPANMPTMGQVAAILSDCEHRTGGPCAITAVAPLAYVPGE